MMNHLAAAAASAVLLAAAPAAAEPDGIDLWVKAVNKQLDHAIALPAMGRTGTAVISFQRGADGRATNIVVRSRDHILARAAQRTLARMGALPPLPSGMPGDQRIVFRMLVGDAGDVTRYERERARMIADAGRHNTELAARLSTAAELAAR